MLGLTVVCALAAGLCAVLGFVVYPARRKERQGTGQAANHPKTGRGKTKKRGRGKSIKKDVVGDELLEKQGLSRAFCAVFVAGAAVCGFFALMMPS